MKMKSKRILPVVIALGILVVFAGTLWFLWAKSRPRPVAVETERPAVRDVVRKVVASGTIEPRKEIEIKPRIPGILRHLGVTPGMAIKRGDLIGEVQLIPDVVGVNDAELRLRSAGLVVERSKRDLERAVALDVSGAVSKMEIDNLRSAYSIAQEELRAAESRVLLLRKGAAGKTPEASASTRVESTIDGTVLAVPVKEGSSVINANSFNPGTTIALVADMSDMIFKGRVDESEVAKLRVGMPVEIVIGAMEDQKLSGKLEQIAPKSQVKDGTTEFEIEAAVRVPAGVVVRAGYSANANIVLDRRDKVLTIDEGLLSFEKDGGQGHRFVEVQTAPQHFERRTVKLGLSDGLHVEVLSGVGPNDVLRKPVRAVATGGKL
jgi:HlyD family secretion protein